MGQEGLYHSKTPNLILGLVSHHPACGCPSDVLSYQTLRSSPPSPPVPHPCGVLTEPPIAGRPVFQSLHSPCLELPSFPERPLLRALSRPAPLCFLMISVTSCMCFACLLPISSKMKAHGAGGGGGAGVLPFSLVPSVSPWVHQGMESGSCSGNLNWISE